MSKNENNILSEAMKEANLLKDILAKNSQNILESAVLSETNGLFEVEDEDEDVSFGEDTEDAEDTETIAFGDEDTEDVADDADVDADDAETMTFGDEDTEDTEDVADVDTDDAETITFGDEDAEDVADEEDVLPIDMTNEPDEDVIKVFKKMSDEDEIEVVGDKVVINDPDSNNEYQIEVPGFDGGEVEIDGEDNLDSEIESLLEGIYNDFSTDEEEIQSSAESFPDEDKPIDLSNVEVNDIDAGSEDEFNIELNEYVGIDYETIVFLQGHDAIEPLEILANQGGDAAIEYLSQWDNGDGGEIVNHDQFGSDDQMYENDIYTIVYNRNAEYIGLYKPQEVIDENVSLEEQIPVGSAQAKRVPATNAISAEITGAGADALAENVKLRKLVNKLIKENKTLKTNGVLIAEAYKAQTEAIKGIRENIKESQIHTANLANVTSIFVEHATTKSEKHNIIKQFSGVKSINESKALKESIIKSLNNNDVVKTTNLTESTVLPTAKSKELKESTVVDNMLARMRGLM